ncbi:Sex-determining transformer protein 1 [Frankliniella fusca]|uniref:Sex-determining transformer protein 1 n=1 Tax=Frankliniella fusca TaxID=407009 RepID=A0AAE1H7G5_9NEOP|nr:Sex-determining transformer protein 1 [Frankliniella fusca]
MDLPCSECKLLFKDIKTFHIHFKRVHQTCEKYTCKVGSCYTSFKLYPSFKQHVKNKHGIPYTSNVVAPPTKVLTSDVNCSELNGSSASEASLDECDISVQPNEEFNFTEFLLKQEDILVAKLYANPAFPRNLVDKVVKDFSDYLSNPYFENFKDLVMSSLASDLPSETKQKVESMFETFQKPFDHLQTEYKRLKYFESCGDYIPPISYSIFSREERVKTKNGVSLKMKDVLGQMIPLRKLFKRFFELPNALPDTLKYLKSLNEESDWVFNIVQGEAWKRKCSSFKKGDIVIPINVYFDEVEPNSALGPHCEPLGCTYVNIPVLPPECVSKLENIFLALLFDADNRSMYGNQNAFKPLLKELKFLGTQGIEVYVPDMGYVRLYFIVAAILGDNKGLNAICGFVESFSAHFYCRICSCPKSVLDSQLYEDPSMIRTPESYMSDVNLNDPKSTGIKELCIFNTLPAFVTPNDISVDEFHDIIEGVAHYTMLPVLRHFNSLNKMFIPTLNSRMYCMDLGVDGDNRPPLICVDRLKCDKLKMTGSEMYTFVRIFGVLVIDMVPENDEFYNLYLLLKDLVDLLHAKALPKNIGPIISLRVKEHNMLYMQLTKENLKPKHHHLVHYERLFSQLGPFGLLSTIRHEAKHRLLSKTCDTCMSRVNLCRTVAIKQQLSFCFRSVSNSPLKHQMIVGPSQLVNLKDSHMFPSYSLTLPDSIFNNPSQLLANWIEYKGTKYQPRQVIVYDTNEEGLFLFAEIQFLIPYDDCPLFICSPLETVGYYSNVRGYEVVRPQTQNLNWFAIEQGKLLDPHPLCIYNMSSGESVIVLKYLI